MPATWGLSFGRSTYWDATQQCLSRRLCGGCHATLTAQTVRGSPLASRVSSYNSGFPNHGAETQKTGPVSSPGGWHLLCAFPTKHLAEQSMASRAKKPPEFANSGCRGPGSCSPHWGLPRLGGSGNTGLRMLLIQHCALKNHFGDKRPPGWAVGRGPGPPPACWSSKEAASDRLWPGPEGGKSAEQATQGQPFQIRSPNTGHHSRPTSNQETGQSPPVPIKPSSLLLPLASHPARLGKIPGR